MGPWGRMKNQRYVEIPGDRTHELPPLLVHHALGPEAADVDSAMLEAEDMLGVTGADPELVEQARFELALQLAESYRALMAHWMWGDSVLEWIRQCEITFEYEEHLRKLLRPDVWPHAGRASFVTLLMDKHVTKPGVHLEKAVGLRLTFRQPPPVDCFSSQFLIYLNATVADTAYHAWSHLTPQALALLPPERFHFEVLDVGGDAEE